MSQVSGFGNYSRNQFLFLSSSGSNLKKEDNKNFEKTLIDFQRDVEDSLELNVDVSLSDLESKNLVEEVSNDNSKLDTEDADNIFFSEDIVYDEKLLMENNPFIQVEVNSHEVENAFNVFKLEEEENKGTFQFDF